MGLMCFLVVLNLMVLVADCYPTGPPIGDEEHGQGLCSTMFPGHGVGPQTTGSPFKIKVGNSCYNSGQRVQVWIKVKKEEDAEIEGFMIQARGVNPMDNSTVYGTFSPLDEDMMSTEYHMGAYTCFGHENNTYGHKGGEVDSQRVSFLWTAPQDGPMDDLVFKATVVKEKTEFWMMVTSPVMIYNSTCEEQPPISSAPSSTLIHLTTSAVLCVFAFLIQIHF